MDDYNKTINNIEKINYSIFIKDIIEKILEIKEKDNNLYELNKLIKKKEK